MNRPDLIIDPEFRSLIRPLTAKEREQLERNLLKDGCRDAIVVWNDIIVDGHNRYEICTAHGIPFHTTEMDFDCRESAIAWICANQLGRRNLNEATKKFLIGIQYDAEKVSRCLRNKQGINQYGRLDPEVEADPGRSKHRRHVTAERIAKDNNVSPATVQKYSIYSKAMAKLKEKAPDFAAKILSGVYKISHDNIVALADLSPEEIDKVMRGIEASNEASRQYKSSRAVLQQVSLGKEPEQEMGTTVKDMPTYDPDAELKGLTLTIPSWVSSLERLQRIVVLDEASSGARLQLIQALNTLDKEANQLSQLLGGGPNE